MNGIGATEWGVDHKGGVLHMPSEEMARRVATRENVDLYSHPPMGAWAKVTE